MVLAEVYVGDVNDVDLPEQVFHGRSQPNGPIPLRLTPDASSRVRAAEDESCTCMSAH